MAEPYDPVRPLTPLQVLECRILARQIQMWRLAKKMSLRKLHKKCNVPISRLHAMEKEGRADPKYSTILRIADGLGISVWDLLHGSPEGVTNGVPTGVKAEVPILQDQGGGR